MILVKDIHKSYKTQQVLKGVKLEVNPGEVQALLGANGSGKSTLIHIIAALIHWQQGEIWIDGEKITLDSYQYRHKVGYVFEKPIYIDKFSAKEYLSFVGEMYGIPKKQYKARVQELLEFLDLPLDNKKYIEDYSKGMKNKVSLAAALIHQPQYLILDEPFDGIDFLAIEKISKLLKNMAQKGSTILITSHQYDVIAAIADKFALLKDGQIVFNCNMAELEGRAKDFEEEPKSVKAYLEFLMNDGNSRNELSWI